jgi:hypothetical protein
VWRAGFETNSYKYRISIAEHKIGLIVLVVCGKRRPFGRERERERERGRVCAHVKRKEVRVRVNNGKKSY